MIGPYGEANEVQAGQIGCETCVLTVEDDGRLTHEDHCTIALYRAALADRDARLTRLVMDAQAVCDRPAMDTLKRLQATLNAMELG